MLLIMLSDNETNVFFSYNRGFPKDSAHSENSLYWGSHLLIPKVIGIDPVMGFREIYVQHYREQTNILF